MFVILIERYISNRTLNGQMYRNFLHKKLLFNKLLREQIMHMFQQNRC